MIRRTFDNLGIVYASQLAEKNIDDLYKIVVWNEVNNIKVFRVTSSLFPWMSEYEFSELPNFASIKSKLKKVGTYVTEVGQRLSFHPGPFNVLASPKDDVVRRSLKDLNQHSEIFDLMGLQPSVYNKINIHVGGSYGDKKSALKRFCQRYAQLNLSTKKRLTVENDDKASQYSASDLFNGVYKNVGVPIVFDFHHYTFCTGSMSECEALELALSTWPENVRPVCHYSESKSIHENNDKIKLQAHSDFVFNKINCYDHNFDVVIEAKAKEQALFEYRRKWCDVRKAA
jgi:UV DNA damage endonuclease